MLRELAIIGGAGAAAVLLDRRYHLLDRVAGNGPAPAKWYAKASPRLAALGVDSFGALAAKHAAAVEDGTAKLSALHDEWRDVMQASGASQALFWLSTAAVGEERARIRAADDAWQVLRENLAVWRLWSRAVATESKRARAAALLRDTATKLDAVRTVVQDVEDVGTAAEQAANVAQDVGTGVGAVVRWGSGVTADALNTAGKLGAALLRGSVEGATGLDFRTVVIGGAVIGAGVLTLVLVLR